MKNSHIECAVTVCKRIVSSFSFSWKRRRDLATAQKELNIPAHQMISEAGKPGRPSVSQNLEVLQSVHKALKPLIEFTDALSGKNYITVSCVKPVLHLFHSSILALQEDDTPLTQSIKTSILDYLREILVTLPPMPCYTWHC